MTTTITCFPNGEFLQGYSCDRRSKRDHPLGGIKERRLEDGTTQISFYGRNDFDRCDAPWQKLGQQFQHECGSIWHLTYFNNFGYQFKVVHSDGSDNLFWIAGSIAPLLRSKSLIALGLSLEPILTEKPKRLAKGRNITSSMKRNLRNGCFLLEKTYGKGRISFLTLTIPDLPDDEHDNLSKHWSVCVANVKKYIKRRQEKYGLPVEYVYCSEYQPSRYERTKRIALHLHIVFLGRRANGRGGWCVTPGAVRKAWRRIIAQFVVSPFESRALENLQPIRTSSSSYLSKYLSKGIATDNDEVERELERLEIRIHWGGMARPVCRLIRQQCYRVDSGMPGGSIVYTFLELMPELIEKKLVSYFSSYDIILTEHTRISIGVGCLSNSAYNGGWFDVIEYICNIEYPTYE